MMCPNVICFNKIVSQQNEIVSPIAHSVNQVNVVIEYCILQSFYFPAAYESIVLKYFP